jgi:hypothetical protein
MTASDAEQGMDTSAVDRSTARAIEGAEARAWADLYAAAPAAWAAPAGLGAQEIGGALVLHWAATGRRYFSRAIGLGVAGPTTRQEIDRVLTLWDELGIAMFLVQSLPHCAPAAYETWLRQAGLEPFDAQDRIVRGGGPMATPPERGGREIAVERIERATAEEWSEFVQRSYRLDTGPWLPELVGRPSWHQYAAREGGEIVASRGMYLEPGGLAWLGMDAPVPGITTHDHAPDAAICAAIVADGLARGARGFIADIEAPSGAMDTPAYAGFAALGFRRPYVRTHWTRP